jgi:ankyrin repeat protein
MTPLSWHVYGGNYDIVKLLISHGAEINADFDDSLESSLKITATDIASNLWRKDESDDFTRTLDLLISKGGKKYADMQL